METTALSIKQIAQMYCVNGKHFADLYRNKISGYADWCERELGSGIYGLSRKIAHNCDHSHITHSQPEYFSVFLDFGKKKKR